MKLFRKIKIRIKNGKSRLFLFFNIPLFQYDIINSGMEKELHYYFPLLRDLFQKKKKQKKMFYLKVNLEYNYAFIAIQNWINIVNEYDGEYVFICDKPSLRIKILQKIVFNNSNIKFIKSYKKPLKNIIKRMVTPIWYNAGYAHLSTFYHAKKNNIESFWNIDADDTTLVTEPSKAVEILKAVEKDCEQRSVAISSIDMWRSRSRGKQWTFGVTYTRDIDKFILYFKNVKKEWQNEYKDCDKGLNIDWFVTSLLNKDYLKIETWYVENLNFIHWGRDGNFISNLLGSYLCYWNQGKLYYPIFEKIIKDKEMGIIPIAEDVKKYDLGLTLEDSKQSFVNRVTRLRTCDNRLKKLWKVNY